MHTTSRCLRSFAVACLLELWISNFAIGQKVEMPLGSGSRLSLTPNDRTVKKFVGDTYVVSCLNGASDTQWFSPSGDKVNGTKISRVRQQLRRGGGGIDLFLQRVTLEEAGLYTCRSKATNVTFNFVVIKPITFDNTLAHQTALEESTFTIKCTAKGQSAVPKLYWKVDGRSPQGPKFKVIKDGLMIHNVSKSDAQRSYVCHAMDIDSPMPDVKSLNIMLHVARKPMEVVDKDTVTEKWAVLGDWANFTCKIDSDPIPSFEWFGSGGQRLTFNDEVSIVNDIVNSSFYSSSLQIRLSKEAQFGTYTCRGGNDIGAVERVFTLRKSVKPSTPFLEVDEIHPQNAKIRVLKYKPLPGEEGLLVNNKSNDLPILNFVVESKLAHDNNFYAAKFQTYQQGFVLLNLLPEASYHVRVALKNALGTGNFSPPLKVTTMQTSPSTTTSHPPVKDEPQRMTPRQRTILPNPPQLPSTTPSELSHTSPCPDHLFRCKNGQCLSYTAKCNGIGECQDLSDEDPDMCKVALSTSTYPSNIIDATEPAPSASRSVSTSAHLPKSPLYGTSARRLFYINGPNGINSINKLSLPPKTLPPPPLSTPPPHPLPTSAVANHTASSSNSYAVQIQTPEEHDYVTSEVVGVPDVTTMNETSVQVIQNKDHSRTKKTTNTITRVATTVESRPNRKTKILTTRKEIFITETVEINEL